MQLKKKIVYIIINRARFKLLMKVRICVLQLTPQSSHHFSQNHKFFLLKRPKHDTPHKEHRILRKTSIINILTVEQHEKSGKGQCVCRTHLHIVRRVQERVESPMCFSLFGGSSRWFARSRQKAARARHRCPETCVVSLLCI